MLEVQTWCHFGKIFAKKTNVDISLANNMLGKEKYVILEKRQQILRDTVKEFIDTNSDPGVLNLLNPMKDNYQELPSKSDIAHKLKI